MDVLAGRQGFGQQGRQLAVPLHRYHRAGPPGKLQRKVAGTRADLEHGVRGAKFRGLGQPGENPGVEEEILPQVPLGPEAVPLKKGACARNDGSYPLLPTSF
ncbi:hypothetical protein kuro4_04470 [Gelria sp. Kuro-4]|nr:hypothetical protein kuro4_04470 [Gelria sp. Kuro-4]